MAEALSVFLNRQPVDFARELIGKIRGNAEWLQAVAGELPHVKL